MLRLENQYPAPPWYAPKLEIAQTKRRELRVTTMTSIIKLAMIVLMARRDLRFFSIRFFAHFAGFILSSSLQCFLCRAARLRLGSSSQTCQRVLTIKPHCFSRPFSSVPTSAVHSDQVPALGSDRFVTVPDCAEGSCLPDNSSTNAGEASHGYEVGREKSQHPG